MKKNKTKKNADTFVDYLCETINAMFESSMFPNSLKLAVVTLLHEKGRKELKEDYRSVSIPSTLSKIFERIIFAQISAFFDNVFSKYQCGFQKGYSIQHCNLKMLDNWEKICRQKKSFRWFLNRWFYHRNTSSSNKRL